MDTYEIRRHNLQALMDEEYGTGARGAKSKLAKRLDKQPDYISRCLYPLDKPGRKNIGEEFARQIEAEYHLKKYSMDSPDAFPARKTLEHTYPVVRGSTESVINETRNVKNFGFWSIDNLFDHIRTEDQSQKVKFLASIRADIAHRPDVARNDKHRAQKLIYAISLAAADNNLTDSEFMILQTAVTCIASRYELEQTQAQLDAKLEELERMQASMRSQ